MIIRRAQAVLSQLIIYTVNRGLLIMYVPHNAHGESAHLCSGSFVQFIQFITVSWAPAHLSRLVVLISHERFSTCRSGTTYT